MKNWLLALSVSSVLSVCALLAPARAAEDAVSALAQDAELVETRTAVPRLKAAAPYAMKDNTLERIPELKSEMLMIWGRQDRFVPMDTGLRLVAGLPNSELHVFNRCGHWAQWEHADKFNRMVLDFLTH